jgi:hypothetical protein
MFDVIRTLDSLGTRIHVSISQSVAVEMTNGTRTRAADVLVAQRKFSILLDTHTLGEHYQLEVSLFEAKLPLLSPIAVSLKDKLRIERP